MPRRAPCLSQPTLNDHELLQILSSEVGTDHNTCMYCVSSLKEGAEGLLLSR